ncbi:MAG: PilZ domain-containing protein [Deltaproteobacteria bacterium]|nr:PilZ domain-containing protein [Deltaproteobacteria bacterium]
MSRSEREHPRYAHEAAISLHFGKQVIEGRSNNVSRGGLSATLAKPIPPGTNVEIDLVLVFDEDTQSEPLRLPARIAWCTPVDEGHQVGLMFHNMDTERVEYLTLFLKYLDDGTQRDRPFKKSANVDDRFG